MAFDDASVRRAEAGARIRAAIANNFSDLGRELHGGRAVVPFTRTVRQNVNDPGPSRPDAVDADFVSVEVSQPRRIDWMIAFDDSVRDAVRNGRGVVKAMLHRASFAEQQLRIISAQRPRGLVLDAAA